MKTQKMGWFFIALRSVGKIKAFSLHSANRLKYRIPDFTWEMLDTVT